MKKNKKNLQFCAECEGVEKTPRKLCNLHKNEVPFVEHLTIRGCEKWVNHTYLLKKSRVF